MVEWNKSLNEPPSTVCMDPVEYAATFLNDRTSEPLIRMAFGLAYAIIFVLGIGGNSLVILSVYKNKTLQSVRNTFIVSLSCSDIAVCLTSVLITPITTMAKQWLFGDAMCYLFPLFQGMSICISTFTLMAIAVDRYILIIHPTKPPIRLEHAVCMIVGIWLSAASVSVPMAVYSYPYELTSSSSSSVIDFATNQTNGTKYTFCGSFCDEQWPSTNSRQLYGTAVLVLQFLIPLTVIGYSYSAICFKLTHSVAHKSSGVNLQHGAALSERQKAVLRRKQRTNRMLIAMVVIFACCWFFQVAINVLKDYNQSPSFITDQPYAYGLLFHSLAMTSTFWNPILYAGMNEAFREAFLDLLPCLRMICSKEDVSRPSNRHSQKRLLSNAEFEPPTALNSDDFNRRLSPPMITTTTLTVNGYSMGSKNGKAVNV